MIRNVKLVSLIFLSFVLVYSCAKDLPPRSYLQTNIVDKTLFDGEWYMTSMVIENNYPSSEGGAQTFPGDSAGDYSSWGFSVARIRWVIDEKYLYAFRSYELVPGANPDGNGNWDSDGDGIVDSYIGEPVAAFKIEKHFDIKRQYNPTTGEEYNVIEENDYDRKWYERRYMRVDWSKNLVTSYQFHTLSLYEMIDIYTREPAEMFIQPGSDFPASWYPQFVFTPSQPPNTSDPNSMSAYMYRFWEEYGPNQLYYMSFVTREIFTPGLVPDPFTGEMVPWCMSIYVDAPICASNSITVRHSFLKLSPNHQYLPQNQPDVEFDRFGLFRNEQSQYDRTDPNDPSDPSYGRTDYKNYTATLHRIWKNYYDSNGEPLPISEREPLAMHVWLTPNFPLHIIREAFNVAAKWGEVFMKLVRINKGIELPDEYYYTDKEYRIGNDRVRGITCTTNQECRNSFGSVDPRTTCDTAVGLCRRHYNPFLPPDPNANDYNCWVGAYDESGNPYVPPDPLGVNPDDPQNPLPPADSPEDFLPDRNLRFIGDECMLVLHVNPCDLDPKEPCVERGDLRYPLFSWIDMPDCPFLGIATIRGDPLTGEFVAGDANIGGWDLHWYRTYAMQMYDLLTGNLTEDELMLGENVRDYIQSLDYVEAPALPIRNWLQDQIQGRYELPVGLPQIEDIRGNWYKVMERAQRLKGAVGRANIYSHRLRLLKGTPFEYQLLNNMETLARLGIREISPDKLEHLQFSERFLDTFSPFRLPLNERIKATEYWLEREGRYNWLRAENVFNDYSVLKYVQDHLGYTRPQLVFDLERKMYNETILHEFGHILGLRHNFTGTTDPRNFHPEYYEIIKRYPYPECTPTQLANGECRGPDPRVCNECPCAQEINFDQNGDGKLDRNEMRLLIASQNFIRKCRELEGMEYYWTASLMDYTPQWYHRLVGLAPHDIASILFNYGRVIEVYDNERGLPPEELNTATGRRVYFRYYSGGEICDEDEDCPYNIGGIMARDLMPVQRESRITQRCLPNPRYPSGRGVCSDTYTDLRDANKAGNTRYVAVEYKFCTDDRVDDRSDCNRMDEGASFQEIVRNLRETYHRNYLWNNFRRYRRKFGMSEYLYRVDERIFMTISKIYHHMFYRWVNEGEAYRNDFGPFGFYDQYLASVEGLNFFAEILATPNIGGYYLFNFIDGPRYIRFSGDPDDPEGGFDLSIKIGQGKYMYSSYQQGLTGILRLERLGIYYDKWLAIEYLSRRDINAAYIPDEPFYVNYYDAFPDEIGNLFGSIIANQVWKYAPRVQFDENGKPHIFYLDWWKGACDYDVSESCRRGEPSEEFESLPYLNDYSSWLIQVLAAEYSLSEFPVYWDTSWEQRLHLFVEGTPDGQEICDCNDPCAQEQECMVEGVDYVKYTSPRWHQTFVAVQVKDDVDAHRGRSFAFEIVKRLKWLDEELRRIQNCALNDPCGYPGTTMKYYASLLYSWERNDIEDFLRYLLQLEATFGINRWWERE